MSLLSCDDTIWYGSTGALLLVDDELALCYEECRAQDRTTAGFSPPCCFYYAHSSFKIILVSYWRLIIMEFCQGQGKWESVPHDSGFDGVVEESIWTKVVPSSKLFFVRALSKLILGSSFRPAFTLTKPKICRTKMFSCPLRDLETRCLTRRLKICMDAFFSMALVSRTEPEPCLPGLRFPRSSASNEYFEICGGVYCVKNHNRHTS